MTRQVRDVDKYLGPTLAKLGFRPEAVDSAVAYGDRPAWAIYYRGLDCKLQVCWSARDGGIDFLLAPLDAPDEFGPSGGSQGWQYLLMLSTSDDGLTTPPLEASDDIWWKWREALLLAHVDEARTALSAEH
ncbi:MULTISPECIES: hypothetical protein [Mycolicibacterium]|uniref:Uncharacterized protein n=1 Tax=Mycolicibacterium senegalense TaxID=1796 RepID=A0A378W3U0_9MYCO|nr:MULTISPECIES: hypothetical protein [Mycolicibacterium]MCV7335558.1 hypothetical protein [Mycolicibacterium senegalense]MDR7288623.1 hypothetical protein [Mycolicibacterium senegalense]QZA25542.1 hypothetical protein K3U95_05535 [Mycolicibacterium senegalense]CDP85290.1 hypothetical protein BN975_02155 [Mycolicibacterium farcinogenes]SUA27803.1 Uncharacterised protein [Mycolicibacterium senegalense]